MPATSPLYWPIAAMLLLLAPSLPAQSDEPVLVFQRIHSLVNHHDNRITLRMWPDDTIEMRFPHYSPMAGHYRWQTDARERSELVSLFETLHGISQKQLDEKLQHARNHMLMEVADADLVRFELRQADRTSVSIMVSSPDVWARHLPDPGALALLNETESTLLQWMRRRAGELP